MILAIDVGGTAIKYALLESVNNFIRQEVPTKIESYEALLKLVKSLITKDVQAVSFSFPGHIDDKGVLIQAGALYQLHGLELKRLLERDLAIPVFVENDANCAALAESVHGNGQGLENFVLITIGTGIGGSIMINGNLLKGKDFTAGELGMMMIRRDNMNFETLHSNASTSALIKQYNLKFKTDFKNARFIMEAYDKNPLVEELIDEWGMNIAYAIFNLSVTLNPEKILIGGGISENDKLILIIQKALDRINDWTLYKTKIETCKFMNNAGIIGAFVNAKERI